MPHPNGAILRFIDSYIMFNDDIIASRELIYVDNRVRTAQPLQLSASFVCIVIILWLFISQVAKFNILNQP